MPSPSTSPTALPIPARDCPIARRARPTNRSDSIIIDKARRSGPQRVRHPRFLGDVGEDAVAAVQEQPHATLLGDEDIRPAVVVDVANRDTGVVPANPESGPFGDILKGSVRPI